MQRARHETVATVLVDPADPTWLEHFGKDLAAADDVIDNSRDLEYSMSQVRALDALYRSLRGVCR